MAFNPITRLEKILFGEKVTPKTRLETAVKHAVDNSGSGGGVDNIVRVPFTLTATQEGLAGSTDAVFADTLTARANGKVIVAAATIDFGQGIVQYIDGIMSGGEAGGDSVLQSTVVALSGEGTQLDAYDIKWKSTGVTATKKEAAVS